MALNHPQQGYHVKLTLESDFSLGARVKHKVFWVNCVPAPAEVQAAENAAEVKAEQAAEAQAAEVLGERVTAAPRAAGRPAVRGARGVAAAAGAALPFTGGALVALLMLGLAGIGTGALMLRYRPKHPIR